VIRDVARLPLFLRIVPAPVAPKNGRVQRHRLCKLHLYLSWKRLLFTQYSVFF